MAIAASLAESSRPAEGTGDDDAGAAGDRSTEDADHADDDDDEEIITFETESEEQDDQAPSRSADAPQILESTDTGPDDADSPTNSTGLGTDPDAPEGEQAHSADAVGDSQESTDDAPSRG